MDNNKNQRAQATGKDIAETVAKGVGKAYGGKLGEKAIGAISKTKGGQKVLNSVGKGFAKSSPATKNILASNSMSRIRHSKSSANSLLGGTMMNTNTSSDMIDEPVSDEEISNVGIDNIKGSGTGFLNKLPVKTKITLLGIGISICSVIIFLVILITPLIELGIIDISDIGSSIGGSGGTSIGFTPVSNNSEYWWPVGSSKTTVSGSVSFASDKPGWTKVTSKYGTRTHPITGKVKKHSGVDIADGSNYGVTNIIAARDGKVIYPSNSDTMNCPSGTGMSTCDSGYGNYVMIQHSDGHVTLYAHLYENSIIVRAGDIVKQGQVIAKMGSSGNSTGTHLHFEVRVNGSTVDPLNYIDIDNPRPVFTTPNYVTGDSNKQSVCLTLKATGFSDDAIAALMTNMFYESSFNPTAIGDNGTSYGLCQWHNDRYDNLRTTFPSSYQTIGSQVEFLMYELENSYVSVYNSLLNESNSYNDLTYSFCSKFEMPSDTENTCKGRMELSQTYYNYVKKNCQ